MPNLLARLLRPSRHLRLAVALLAPLCASALTVSWPTAPFHLTPAQTGASQAFTLRVLNPEYSCSRIFYNQTLAISGLEINVSFRDSAVIQNFMCTNSEFGPSFDVPALAAGAYEVYFVSRPICANGIMCGAAVAPRLLGTITVGSGGPTGITINPTREKGESHRLSATLHSRALELVLPATARSSGRWSYTLSDLSGRTLESEAFAAGSGETVVLPWSRKLFPGFYWLRLNPSGGEPWTARVVLAEP